MYVFFCSFVPNNFVSNRLNLISIGALTSKFYNFSARPWELKISKTIDFFDFFANPVSVHLKGSEIVRVTSFDCKYWISNSSRFFINLFESDKSMHPVFQAFGAFTKISWFEAAIAINSALFEPKEFLNMSNFYPVKLFPEYSSSLKIFSVGRYIDVKDLNIIRAKKFREKNSYIRFPYLNGFSYTASVSNFKNSFPLTKFKDIVSNNGIILENMKFCFIFFSDLHLESPLLNAKIKSLVEQAGMEVYLFGVDNTQFFNYKTTYVGDITAMHKLFSGRLKHLSRLFFSGAACSIFGFSFRKSGVFSSIWFQSLLGYVLQVIFLQPDFSQNSAYLFQNKAPGNDLFWASGLKFSNYRFCLFNFNSAQVFHFPGKFSNFNFSAVAQYFAVRAFNFGYVTPSPVVMKNFVFYTLPASMFVSSATFYLNLSNRFKSISRIGAGSLPFGDNCFFNVANYVFDSVWNKYRRYRFHYFFSSNAYTNPIRFNNKFSCSFIKSKLPFFSGYSFLFQFLYVSYCFILYTTVYFHTQVLNLRANNCSFNTNFNLFNNRYQYVYRRSLISNFSSFSIIAFAESSSKAKNFPERCLSFDLK